MYLTVFVSDWFLCLKHQASSCDWKKLEMNMNWNKRSIYQSHSTVLCYEVLIRRSLWTRVWLLPQYLLCEDQMTQRFCIFWLAIKSYFIWLCYVKLIDRIDWNKCTKICWFWKFQIHFPDMIKVWILFPTRIFKFNQNSISSKIPCSPTPQLCPFYLICES